jgi:hypothetical protein
MRTLLRKQIDTLLPVIDRLRQRFAIGRVCVVADRGMISEALSWMVLKWG